MKKNNVLSEKKTIIIVEDAGVVCMAYEAMFASMGFEVLQVVDNYVDANQALRDCKPDICTLDLRIRLSPGANASLLNYAQIRNIMNTSPETAVCAITESDSLTNIELVLAAGVQGFFTKTFDPKELAMCFNHIMRGDTYYQQSIASTKVLTIAQRRMQKKTSGSPFKSLSPTLAAVCGDILYGMSVSDIAKRRNLSPSTISRYRQKIRDLLGVENDVQLVYKAQCYGFIDTVSLVHSYGDVCSSEDSVLGD